MKSWKAFLKELHVGLNTLNTADNVFKPKKKKSEVEV